MPKFLSLAATEEKINGALATLAQGPSLLKIGHLELPLEKKNTLKCPAVVIRGAMTLVSHR
jgi:hypothetical protein